MLTATHLELTYTDGGGKQPVFTDVNLAVPAHGLTILLGPSGSGKSSLLYVLAGLRPPTGGTVAFEGQAYEELGPKGLERLRRQRFGFVFQQHFLVSYMNVLQNVLVGAPQPDRAYAGKAVALLQELGLGHCVSRAPAALSGGERQRVALARALVNSPAVLFADEPTASLDQDRARQVMALLRSIAERCAVVLVTHDLALIQPGDRVFSLRNGALGASGEFQGHRLEAVDLQRAQAT